MKTVGKEELDKYSVEELKEGIVQEVLHLVALLKPLEDGDGDIGRVQVDWSENGLDEVIWRANYLDQKGHGYNGDPDAINEELEAILEQW